MNVRRLPAAVVVFSLPAFPLFAASPDSAATFTVSSWFQFASHPYNPSARDVFEAFQSKSGRSTVAAGVSPLRVDAAPAIYPDEFRSLDGRNNAPKDLGAAGQVNLRNVTVGYADGSGTPAGPLRKSARDVSNIVCAQAASIVNSQPVSSFLWNWGNFVDHDMALTRVASPPEDFVIPVPKCDPSFDPRCNGLKTLPFQRASYTVVDNVRQQINANSAFIDGSVVYGSDNNRGHALRLEDGMGTGHLATSTGNLMPFNTDSLTNQPARGNPPDFFLGGDVRSNENSALCAMQTLWVREHNFWADTFANQGLDDDGIYLRARAIVGAEIQLITYRDFLPILLGPNALTPYTGYNQSVDPRVSIAFSAAAFRLGHTFLPSSLMRLNKRGISIGDISLGQSIFAPNLISAAGIEPFLRGLAKQQPQEVDAYIITDIRSFIIQGATGFDLVALDIQRGRDVGLPSYNQTRIDYGLAPKASFAEMTSDANVQFRLSQAYTSPDDLDVFIGGLVEDHVNGGQVGELFWTIIKDQFERSRDGDRFWYETYLDAATLATVQAQSLGTIIKRNCSIGNEMQDDVFHVPGAH